jgi:TRAP-type mannitol/chloroaromatic compound transport system permease large subunit
MGTVTDNFLLPITKFSLLILQLLLVLAFILAGIGVFWSVSGNGHEPLIWALKTLLPASIWGVIYFGMRILIAKLNQADTENA